MPETGIRRKMRARLILAFSEENGKSEGRDRSDEKARFANCQTGLFEARSSWLEAHPVAARYGKFRPVCSGLPNPYPHRNASSTRNPK
jgi:hypothetical protein